MEYLDGVTLAELVEHSDGVPPGARSTSCGRWPPHCASGTRVGMVIAT